jgi:hypothetical protein
MVRRYFWKRKTAAVNNYQARDLFDVFAVTLGRIGWTRNLEGSVQIQQKLVCSEHQNTNTDMYLNKLVRLVRYCIS